MAREINDVLVQLTNPVQWPATVPRTEYDERRDAAFRRKGEGWRRHRRQLGEARDFIVAELVRFGATHVVVTLDADVNANEWAFTQRRREPDDPGVAVYFDLDDGEQVIAIDQYDRVADNMWAVARTIEALRQIERDGGPRVMRAAVSGFKALPESTSGRSWWDVLELERDATADEVRRAYRRLAKVRHPDTGGSDAEFAELANAMRQGLGATEGQVI